MCRIGDPTGEKNELVPLLIGGSLSPWDECIHKLWVAEQPSIWRVLYCMHCISSCTQPARGNPLAWGLGEVLSTMHQENLPCYKTIHKGLAYSGLRGTRQWECRKLHNEELYDLCFSPNIIWVQNQEDRDVWGILHVWGKGEVHTGFLWENLRKRDCLEDLSIDWRITVKWIFKKWDEQAWMGLV